jgi:hypothetical protein
MRYTNYILNGSPVQPDTFISDKRGLKTATTITVMPVAIIGAVFVGGMIPVAMAMDLGRYMLLKHYVRQKALRRRRYVDNVLVSLGHGGEERWFNLLNVA